VAITCRVVSPERPLFDGEVERLVAPGTVGELGIYPRHAPLIAKLGPGVVRLHTADGVQRMAVRDGFMQVRNDDVIVLVTKAVRPEDVERAEVEKALEIVLAELRHPESEERFVELLDRRLWLTTCLKIYTPPRIIEGTQELADSIAT